MANNVIRADGVVEGTIRGFENTNASVMAEVSCINSTPTGSISGTVEFPSEQFTRRFTFSSDSPFVVATLQNIQSIGAAFDNVILQENAFTPITGCQAFLNATQLTSNTWVGSFVITCPSGEQLFIYGVFTGNILVNRSAFCRPLL